MSALLLDAGKSHLKWALGDAQRLTQFGVIAQADIQSKGLAVLASRLPARAGQVLISNVAGASFGTRLRGFLRMHYDCDARFARVQKHACGVTNGYRHPRRLGVDRWAAMIGARAEFDRACLVVDVDTVVRIDAIDEAGLHLGGQMLPGLNLMAESLSNTLPDMPSVDLRRVTKARARTLFAGAIESAIPAGCINAVVGSIERAAKHFERHKAPATVVLTGGDTSRILKAFDAPVEHRPHLVLAGLARMLDLPP